MRLIFVIVITFFLFWTPYSLIVFLSAFQDSLCEHCSQLDLAIEVTEVIACAHCCVNPVVYVFFFQKYRRVLWVLLYQLTKCRCFLHKEARGSSLHVHFTGEEESCPSRTQEQSQADMLTGEEATWVS